MMGELNREVLKLWPRAVVEPYRSWFFSADAQA